MGSSYNKLLAIEAILRLKKLGEDHLKQLNNIISKWQTLSKDRNRAVHDPVAWFEGEQGLIIMHAYTPRRTGPSYTAQPFDFTHYGQLGNEINIYTADFVEFPGAF